MVDIDSICDPLVVDSENAQLLVATAEITRRYRPTSTTPETSARGSNLVEKMFHDQNVYMYLSIHAHVYYMYMYNVYVYICVYINMRLYVNRKNRSLLPILSPLPPTVLHPKEPRPSRVDCQ